MSANCRGSEVPGLKRDELAVRDKAWLGVPIPGRDGFIYNLLEVEAAVGLHGEPGIRTRPVRKSEQARVAGDVVLQFARLSTYTEALETEVLRFASTYGLLGLCDHGRPVGHDADCHFARIDGVDQWEPIGSWLRYSNQVRAILNVTSRLQIESCGTCEEWQLIAEGDPDPTIVPCPPNLSSEAQGRWRARNRPDFPMVRAALEDARSGMGNIGYERKLMEYVLQNWSRLGGTSVEAFWVPAEPRARIHVQVDGLAGAIAVGLMAAAQVGVYICCYCGFTYEPDGRKPNGRKATNPGDLSCKYRQAKRHQYCEECRRTKRSSPGKWCDSQSDSHS